jgi:hypothetical protein
MSAENEQIKSEFEKFATRFGPKTIVPATVLEVNADDTIKVQFSDDSEVDDCRLKAVVKAGNKVLLIPAVGSIVLIGKIENSDEYIVLAVDEVSEFAILVEDVRFSVDNSGFLMQKQTDTLKQVLTLIVQSILKIIVLQGTNPDIAKLQQALTKINNLLR